MAKRFLSPINFVNLSSDPASGTDGDIYYNSVSNKFKYYNGSAWVDLASGGATLSETAPSSPSEGDTWFKESTNSFYIYDGTYWVEIATTVDAGGVTSLTGTANEVEVSASTGAVTISLPATINANTTGSAATLTTSRTIALTGDVTGSASFNGGANASISSTLANTAVTPTSYGSASAVATFTVDSKGRLTAASNTNIAIAQSAVTNLTNDLSAKAPLESPTFTGTVTVPGLTSSGDLLPNSDNTGVVGNASFTWNNGQFTNLTVDSVLTVTSTLNVRSAIDLADSDILRFGTSDDVQMFYNGSTNIMNVELEAAAVSLNITDNGTDRVVITKSTGTISAGTPTEDNHLTTKAYVDSVAGGSGISYQTTAPTSPSIGDIWVDSDETYVTINPNDYVLKADVQSGAYVPYFFMGGM